MLRCAGEITGSAQREAESCCEAHKELADLAQSELIGRQVRGIWLRLGIDFESRFFIGWQYMTDMSSKSKRRPIVGVIQMTGGADREAKLVQALNLIRQAAQAGVQIVCLQEVFTMLYPCQTEDYDRFAWAEPIPGPTSAQLQQVAAEQQVVVVGSLFERRAAGIYHNTAVVFDADGEYLGCYRKMHIPDDPCYYEKFYFAPGDLGFPCFDTHYGRIGVGICWDQWFPEAARALAINGAEILFYPTAIGWLHEEKTRYGASQHEAWETMLRSHAIANGLFVAAANRVGIENRIEFWGSSVLVDPYGQILQRAAADQTQTVMAACDLTLVDTARIHWPFFRDRRTDAYQELAQRWHD